MRLRKYTVEVVKTQTQTVTFVVDMDERPWTLSKVAAGYINDSGWTDVSLTTPNVTSREVLD